MNFYIKSYFKKGFADKQTLEHLLKSKLNPNKLCVTDISGGCGQSFSIDIESFDFKGKSIIQQHRLVNSILKEEMKDIRAVQLKTAIPTLKKEDENEKSN